MPPSWRGRPGRKRRSPRCPWISMVSSHRADAERAYGQERGHPGGGRPARRQASRGDALVPPGARFGRRSSVSCAPTAAGRSVSWGPGAWHAMTGGPRPFDLAPPREPVHSPPPSPRGPPRHVTVDKPPPISTHGHQRRGPPTTRPSGGASLGFGRQLRASVLARTRWPCITIPQVSSECGREMRRSWSGLESRRLSR